METSSKKITRIVATFFGVGYIPVVPATWASAVSALLAWFMGPSAVYWAVLFSIAGLWACREAREAFKSDDPKQFVMDEVCGMLLAILWLPKTLPIYVCAFFVFRFFDIAKPWPISKIQDSKPASSIMWDDLLAGVFTNLTLQAVLWIARAA